MLPSKLAALKQELEDELHLSNDDKATLALLRILDNDRQIQEKLISNDMIKSLTVASSLCPCCGRRM